MALFGSTVTWTSGVALTRSLLRLAMSGWSLIASTMAIVALSTSAADLPGHDDVQAAAAEPEARGHGHRVAVGRDRLNGRRQTGTRRVQVGVGLEPHGHGRAVGGPAEEGRLEDLRAGVALGRDARLDELDGRIGEDDVLGFDALGKDARGRRAGRRRHRHDEGLLRACVDELRRQQRGERRRCEEQQGGAAHDRELGRAAGEVRTG